MTKLSIKATILNIKEYAMYKRNLFYAIIFILPFWFLLNGCATAQNKEEKKEEEVMPAPIEAEDEASEKGFAKEMPDVSGLSSAPELLLSSYTAKAEKKDDAIKLAKDGAISGLSQQIDNKLGEFQKSIKKEKLKNEKEITDLFADAGKKSKLDLIQNPVVADSSVNKNPDGWEASIMLELKVVDLSKKLIETTKDKPEFKKTKLYKELEEISKTE
jgi:hypothetical protein